MNILQIAQIVIGSIVGLGALIAGTGYAYSQFFQGKDKFIEDERKHNREQTQSNTETLALLQGQVTSLQTLAKEQREDILTQRDEITKLRTLLEDREKKIKELTDILQNRSPQIEQIAKQLSDSMVMLQDYVKTSGQMLAEIRNFIIKLDK